MAKLITSTRSGSTVGVLGLGVHGDGVGSIRQQVHDGDTVIGRALGNVSVRFLGVDTPEVSFMFPGTDQFTSIANPRWESYLADPWNAVDLAPFKLTKRLTKHLITSGAVGPHVAANHALHARVAHEQLEALISQDQVEKQWRDDQVRFFLFFASEVMDRYGRLLAYVNRDDPGTPREQRPLTYNERLLQAGLASPYFIWPNIDPFKKASSYRDAVVPPKRAAKIASRGALGAARTWVKHARQANLGIYDAVNPLRLEPFELRYLAGRRVPNRWVIDLGAASNRLIEPQDYWTIANSEDRLFIPEEYVPLFRDEGWKLP